MTGVAATTTRRRRRPAPWLCLALLLGGCAPAAPELEISDARVRAPIPGRDMTAGYFNVQNHGAEAVVLTGADSAAARAVEMHLTTSDGGMMQMRRLDEVVVEAGDTVRFEPGGRHLMLFGVSSLGDGIDITLRRSNGEPIVARFTTVAVGEG